jgi:hypothetical protein
MNFIQQTCTLRSMPPELGSWIPHTFPLSLHWRDRQSAV